MTVSPADRREWDGLVSHRIEPSGVPKIALVVDVGSTWSAPVRVTADDGHDYFVKFQELCPTPGSEISVVTEFVAPRVGRYLGAPVCSTSIVELPTSLRGYEIRPGKHLTSRFAHGSLALEHCEEGRPNLGWRPNDDNRRRHVGGYAMYDLFFGADQQWLYDIDADRTLYSHDHGLYLPPNDGIWNESTLMAHVDDSHPLPDDPSGLDTAAISEMVTNLRDLDRATLASILKRVPSSWGVADNDLEGLGWFLERRAPAVAERLQRMTP